MNWQGLIVDPVQSFVSRLAAFVPQLLMSGLAVAVGWFLATIVRSMLLRFFGAIGLDRLAEKARLSEVLHRGAIRLSFSELLAHLCYWLMIVFTVIIALQYLGVTAANEWLERFGSFIPRVIVSIVILLFGMLVASFLSATVRAASLNAGFPHGHLLGQGIYVMIVILSAIMAMEQLQFVTRTIEIALYIAMGATGLAFALAVGLGSRTFVEEFLRDLATRWKRGQGL